MPVSFLNYFSSVGSLSLLSTVSDPAEMPDLFSNLQVKSYGTRVHGV